MEFHVFSRGRAKRESYKINKPTAIISITDPDKELNHFAKNPNIVGICRVQFHDTDPDILVRNEILMTNEDAIHIKNFVIAMKDKVDCIIVHCEAGISRSAGIMAAIQKFLIGSDEAIFGNRKFAPNMYCYRLVYNALFDIPEGSVFGEIEK